MSHAEVIRAVVLRQFGPPHLLRVEDVPGPEPGAGEVLVDVTATSVVFVDTQVRAGRPPNPAMAPDLPVVLGNGVVGRVRAVGPEVDSELIGTRVAGTTGGSGGYAERALVSVDDLMSIPEEVTAEDAAALLADGRTALGLVRLAAPEAGEWVLVEAAGGGVGSLLVQLAHRAGARVIGAASTPEKRELARMLGAEVVIDYTTQTWTEQVRHATAGHGVSVVFDGVGGQIGRTALGLVEDGGRFVVHGGAAGPMTTPSDDEQRRVAVLGLGGIATDPDGLRQLSREALASAAAGHLRPTVGQTFPLDGAADAHAAIEARATLGKTLLLPGPTPGRRP